MAEREMTVAEMQASRKRGRAKELLTHYLEILGRGAGVDVEHPENTAEIEEIVDAIVDAAVLEARMPHLVAAPSEVKT